MDVDRMKRSLACLAVFAGVTTVPAGVVPASGLASARRSSYPIYCIPPKKPSTAAHNTVHADVATLSALTAAKLAAKGNVTLPVSTPGPGSVKIVLTAESRHHRTVVIGSGKTTATVATCSATVDLTLTAAGKALLSEYHRGGISASLTVTFQPSHGRSATATGDVTLR
jgi:hypothetical protein